MKKYVIIAFTIILLFFTADAATRRLGFYIDFKQNEPVETFVKIDGKNILLDTGQGFENYEIRGVDMGAGIPGHFATDYAIDKETYLRWIRWIKEMGANTIRVYTILSDDFYNAVYEYNFNNPDPIYIIHGVWVNDYVQYSHRDAYDKDYIGAFMEDSETLVDIIHGNRRANLGYGTSSTSGVYTKDISPWVLGYILGVEWEDYTVGYTDHVQADKALFRGTYMYTTEDASAFEAMLARVGEHIIQYETKKYKQQRLVAFSNWPTTDPLEYPETVARLLRKFEQVDVEHIKTTEQFLAGQFASYHIYPYYPDYLKFYETWKQEGDYNRFQLDNGKTNTYGAYLTLINAHHTMPVIISEFGVPTSRGRAQNDFNTERAQGYMSEGQQGQAIIDCYKDIMDAGCAGSIIFTWQDEWFKRTWNTMAYVDLMRTPYWSDYQTNEQYFGLLAFDPGEETSVCYTDGDVSEWLPEDHLLTNQGYELSMKYDEKYIYFRIHKEDLQWGSEKIYIPIDVTEKSGSNYADGENVRFQRAADFLIVLDGKENSRILVQERYEPFRFVFSENYLLGNPFLEVPAKNSPTFKKIYLALQYDTIVNGSGQREVFETGKLTYGNGNPEDDMFDSTSDFIVKGDDIEMRLPWQLLNFANPSEMKIHDDYYEKYGIEYLKIDGMYLGIGDSADQEQRIPMEKLPLKGWGKHITYHERLKSSYYMIQELWGKAEEE